MKQKTWLVTGGNGNLARQLVPILVSRKDQVVSFDLGDPDPEFRTSGVLYYSGDIRDRDSLRRLLEEHRPEVILHFASLLSGKSEEDRNASWAINATASIHLMEDFLQTGAGTFFFPSTGASYGGLLPDPLPEDHPQWPENLYGATKVAVERAGVYYQKRHGLDFRSLRLPMVLSPYAPAAALTAYASHAFQAAVEGRPFRFPVSADTAMSTLYIRDVLQAILGLVDAPEPDLQRRVYNVHAFSPSARAIGEAIRKRCPDFQYSFEPDPVVDALLNSWPAIHEDASARRDWNWKPDFDLETTTDDLLGFFRSRGKS